MLLALSQEVIVVWKTDQILFAVGARVMVSATRFVLTGLA